MAREYLGAAEVARAAGLAHAPTPEQTAVIEAPLRPMLVVAGAGSGKTETMAARVVWLVANGLVAPDQVLGLTFTRKAAAELAERIDVRLRRLRAAGLWVPAPDEEGAEVLGGTPTVATYHSYAGRLVREHALRLGYEPDSRLLSEAAAWQYAAEAVSRYDGDMSEMGYAESTAIGAVVDLAGELAEHLVGTDQVREEIDRVVAAIDATPLAPRARATPEDVVKLRTALRARRALLPIVDAFAALKRSRDAVDFADEVALAARLALGFPDIGAGERARFRVVLLDEFQDTSEAQLVLLRALFAAGDGGVPVTAVGDPNQSIYGWRGASATTLTRFPAEFSDGSPAPVRQLATTWRNDASILRVANHLAAPLRASARVDVAPLAVRPDAGVGDVTVARVGTHLQEAAYLASWLTDARSRAGTTAAVLCRKRSQFGPVMEALDRADIPYEVVGLGGLLLTPEILDLVAALRAVADPSRGDALMRLLTGPMCRLGAADLDGLHAWAKFRQRVVKAEALGRLPLDLDPGHRDEDEGLDDTAGHLVDLAPEVLDEPSIVEALDDLPPEVWRGPEGEHIGPVQLGRLRGLAGAMRRLRRLAALPLPDLVGEAERALGLDVEVLSRPGYTPDTARAHLDAFADVAADFASSADRPTLIGFLAWLDAAIAEERGLERATVEPSAEAVQILTVHAAKGLEWDVVVVPGLVEGTFPARQHSPMPKHDGERWTVKDPTTSGWLVGLAGVPYPLRGDRDGLPTLRYAGAADTKDLAGRIEDFKAAEGQRELAEERRLAYVAVTRARRRLLLTASVWTTTKSHKVTSQFLREVVRAREELGVQVAHWEPMPDPAEVGDNPVAEDAVLVLWPRPPDQARLQDAQRAAAAVAAGRAQFVAGDVGNGEGVAAGHRSVADEADGERRWERGGAGDPGGGDAAYPRAAVHALPVPVPRPSEDPYAADVDLLLAERAATRRTGPAVVEVPRHLSASDLVHLAQDPERFASERRRPMPAEPALAARRGTAFHAWVEQHYARAALLDPSDLPGAADDDPGSDAELPALKATFLASEWAARTPVDVEVAIETVLDGIAVRGRIDAVFARPDGGVTVVDWKTGSAPSGVEAEHRSLQLGAYAVAYARLRGLTPDQVDAAFYYARTGTTVRPELPGEDELLMLLGSIE
ncbi:MAG: ATP-dependent helicase [Actinomycetales bacterium]|nr:ATP-dependent helicase [Candidatus Phosphoribacter baldrii]